ncbi:hypothetical protein [Rhizobium sp. ZW T2_16]|jgi:hypothetical protein|uniref:hypothetical protein n=1 Tax=Rhizobium sp. ZW T2_16 TaxID=3378083 RepID=UPI003851C7F6
MSSWDIGNASGRNARVSPTRVSKKVNFPGNGPEKFSQSVLFDPIQPKPFCEIADQHGFGGA